MMSFVFSYFNGKIDFRIDRRYIFLLTAFFGLFLYFDPTLSWIEIANITRPGEAMGENFNPFQYMYISREMVLLFFFQSVVTMFFGYVLFAQLWNRLDISFITKLMASFIPGFLALVAISRITTAFLSHSSAPTAILLVEILVIAISAYVQKRQLTVRFG